MFMYQETEEDPFPEWTLSIGMGLLEPNSLYMQWMTFLYSIWQKIDYV
jgi:hypothetical protein